MNPDRKQKIQGRHDYILLALILGLTIFGLAIVASATGPMGFERFNDSYHFIRRQLFTGVVPGVIGFLFFALFDFKRWEKLYAYLYGVAVLALLVVFLPGVGNIYGTAHSWVSFGGFSFQTSELVKLVLIIALSGWLATKGKEAITDLKAGYGVFLGALGLVLLLLALQPDVGGMAIIAFIAIAIYFVAGAHLGFLALMFSAGVGLLALLIKLKPYRADRFMVFLHPELDPKGAGYHINQALLTIGSGGLFGLGFGHSRQKYQYLPEVAGDSIFAVMAEELGLIICIILLSAFLALIWRIVRVANTTKDPFVRYLAIGIGAWIAGQVVINIGGMSGIMPMTGLTLPFISQGGSSLAMLLSACGLLFQISGSKSRNS